MLKIRIMFASVKPVFGTAAFSSSSMDSKIFHDRCSMCRIGVFYQLPPAFDDGTRPNIVLECLVRFAKKENSVVTGPPEGVKGLCTVCIRNSVKNCPSPMVRQR